MIIFFFQAEGGIRDKLVTGVQTCALPISRVAVSLRRHIKRVVRWSRAGIARYRSIRFRLLRLLPASDLFLGCKARGDPTLSRVHGVSLVCRVAERCTKERHGIASARPR